MKSVKRILIDKGVDNLIEYGYLDCNKDNILTDPIYSAFFLKMLEEQETATPEQEKAVADLIQIIKTN